MQRVLTVLTAGLLLLPGSAAAPAVRAAACGPGAQDACCCDPPEEAPAGPALTTGCCCELQPAEGGAPLPEQPRRSGADGPGDLPLATAESCGPPALPNPAPQPAAHGTVKPRAPPGPLHLLYGVFLC